MFNCPASGTRLEARCSYWPPGNSRDQLDADTREATGICVLALRLPQWRARSQSDDVEVHVNSVMDL